MNTNKPRIFISHCEKNMVPTLFAMRIIELLGCIPVIAEQQPKGSNSILDVVTSNMNSCDAVIVIATKDQKNGESFSPSNGVSEELGILKNSEKLKHKYFVIIEEGVSLSAMNSTARYKFNSNNLSIIAEAILIELGSMGYFRNYYEMPGSEIEIHKLMETLSSFKKIIQNRHAEKEQIMGTLKSVISNFVEQVISQS